MYCPSCCALCQGVASRGTGRCGGARATDRPTFCPNGGTDVAETLPLEPEVPPTAPAKEAAPKVHRSALVPAEWKPKRTCSLCRRPGQLQRVPRSNWRPVCETCLDEMSGIPAKDITGT